MLGAFFYRIYEFLFSFANPPSVTHRPVVPDRYAIKFVAASDTSPTTDNSVLPVTSTSIPTPTSTVYSVVSSANFVPTSLTDYSVSSSANFVTAPSSSTNFVTAPSSCTN